MKFISILKALRYVLEVISPPNEVGCNDATANPAYMLVNCRKSCGVCTTIPSPQPPSTPAPTPAPTPTPPAGSGQCCYGGCGQSCQGGWCGLSQGNCEGNCGGEWCTR